MERKFTHCYRFITSVSLARCEKKLFSRQTRVGLDHELVHKKLTIQMVTVKKIAEGGQNREIQDNYISL